MDMKNTFLHGDLEEEIYMKQPAGYIEDPSLVCNIRESFHGMKQAPQAWYAKMHAFLLSHKFESYKSDCNVYMQKKGDCLLLIVFYVDEFLITGGSPAGLRVIKSTLRKCFSMIDIGLLRQFIGLEESQNDSGIMISQSIYVGVFLKRFHMIDCKETFSLLELYWKKVAIPPRLKRHSIDT